MNEENLRKNLYEKLKNEYDIFCGNLINLDKEEIIKKAYEITTKEDILYCFDPNGTYFDIEQIKFLLKRKSPLNEVYNDYLKYDIVPRDMYECINDYLLETINISKKRNNIER